MTTGNVRTLALGASLVFFAAKACGTEESPVASPALRPTKLAGQKPVRVIFDTDFDTDCDDAGALGVLHALANQGEVEILGVAISGLNEYSGPAVDAVNTYYGRPDLPIGTARKPAPMCKSRYTRIVAKKCPHDLRRSGDAPDATTVYRDILAAQPDDSVTIITVGYMTNLAKLLATPASGNLPSGKDLIQQKVKLWVCMGGNFHGKPAVDDLRVVNPNFTTDKEATFTAVTGWPTPIVFVGREVCSVPSGLKAGAKLAETPKENPVRVAYAAYFGGRLRDRHVADLVTVLFAVRGLGDYWDAEEHGGMDLQPNMKFTWSYSRDRGHAYLLKRKEADGGPNDNRIEEVLNGLLTQTQEATTP